MADLVSLAQPLKPASARAEHRVIPRASKSAIAIFIAAMLGGVLYIALHVARDLDAVRTTTSWPYVLLGLALLIALGFEFVNGFHDTANAVATVIYTNSLTPNSAVVLSGICNLLGVLVSSGAVAFAIITLLPVDLILQVSSGAGFAMVFALLLAAILWNLGTWWLGLPASSSHTMVGSIIGVGIAHQLLNPQISTSGVDWDQARKVLESLLISPIIGFVLAGALLLLSKRLLRHPSLYEAPRGNEPPPFPIRALMVLTCTGVSFSHGQNDGQKGMGLIMLILIGTVPTAYALNHAVSPMGVQDFIAASERAVHILDQHSDYQRFDPAAPVQMPSRAEVTEYIRTRNLKPATLPALRDLVNNLDIEVSHYGEYKAVPARDQANVRNDMYVASEALRLMHAANNPQFSSDEWAALDNYKSKVDNATKYIPTWVKVAVALALGLGTMVGWKRVVVTVGEKIGKAQLTYAQGAAAGVVAATTIFAATGFGLPVSTTHILSSGVAGTMAANGSGLRLKTIRNIAAAWVFTLPAAALLSAGLYWVFWHLTH
ncbi:MAG TPA: inorganic phosphate transporter [Terracidiphilus sp.]|nr:inorganic phosphate transporter [Terracidiphilus sp.]